MGVPTVDTIWGNTVAPWLRERYLAESAISGQLSDVDTRPDRPDNLYEPPPGDPGAHRPYDDRAHAWSMQVWRPSTGGEVGATALLGLAGIVAGR